MLVSSVQDSDSVLQIMLYVKLLYNINYTPYAKTLPLCINRLFILYLVVCISFSQFLFWESS